MSQRITRAAAAQNAELLTDPQGAALLNLGVTRFQELQKTDPEFPAPVWLGERGKRHVRSELWSYAMSKRRATGANGGAA